MDKTKQGETHVTWASLVAQLVKNLPAVWETWVQSLSWEDPLEKGKTIYKKVSINIIQHP